MNEPRILIVEDEANIRRFVRLTLAAEGYEVFEAASLQRGLIEAGTRHPDMLVLDLGLPDGDGIDLIRDLRAWSAAPVIVLSARSSEEDKIAALDAGADDYLVKPFGAGELLARVRAQLRRHPGQAAGEPLLCFGEICIDFQQRSVERAGEAVHLAVTAVPGAQLEASEVLDFLRRQLPKHMVPAGVHVLPQLPQTASGKVSRGAVRGLLQG